MVKNLGTDASIDPYNIKSDSDFNMRMLVLQQVNRINQMLSTQLSLTKGVSSNYRSLGYGVKSGLFSLESMIYPSLKKDSEYFKKVNKLKIKLKQLEDMYEINSQNFLYWRLLNVWLRYLSEELSKLGYFPTEAYEYEQDLD